MDQVIANLPEPVEEEVLDGRLRKVVDAVGAKEAKEAKGGKNGKGA